MPNQVKSDLIFNERLTDFSVDICRLCTITTFGANAIIFAFAPIENENRTLDQEEQKKFRKQALIILVLADMAIIISHKIHIEVCQWLLNGMIVAALLNLCGKIQTKCKLEKIW